MRRLAPALVTLALLGASCSSPPSIDEYGAQLQEKAVDYATEEDQLGRRHLADLDAAVAELQQSHEGEALVAAAVDATAERTAKLFAGIADSLDRYVADIGDLDLPDDVASAHRAYLDALEAAGSGIGTLLDSLADADSFEAIDRAISGSGYADAQHRVRATCLALESALGDTGVEVDLRCEPEA
ncbi:MAG: hypothetical protein ABFS21_06680 [Actinomycetota bacterium]